MGWLPVGCGARAVAVGGGVGEGRGEEEKESSCLWVPLWIKQGKGAGLCLCLINQYVQLHHGRHGRLMSSYRVFQQCRPPAHRPTGPPASLVYVCVFFVCVFVCDPQEQTDTSNSTRCALLSRSLLPVACGVPRSSP